MLGQGPGGHETRRAGPDDGNLVYIVVHGLTNPVSCDNVSKMRSLVSLGWILSCVLLAGCARDTTDTDGHTPLRVAVASNFAAPMLALAAAFTDSTGTDVSVSTGSTGRLYAQIRNGAPFDAFFSADSERPKRLEAELPAADGTRFTFARGRLVLWDPSSTHDLFLGNALRDNDIRHIAIANPDLAPYGAAARETLEGLGLWDELQGRLVRGENIAQAYQFAVTGHAGLAFVARSQVSDADHFWLIPDTLHTAIEQQAISLSVAPAALDFLDFVRSDAGRRIIRSFGYETP